MSEPEPEPVVGRSSLAQAGIHAIPVSLDLGVVRPPSAAPAGNGERP